MNKPRLGIVLTTVAVLSATTSWAGTTPKSSGATSSADGQGQHAILARRVEALLSQRAATGFPEATVTVRSTPLDPRLRLAACEELELTPRGENLYGRIPVAARCLAPQPWSVFLTGDVSVALPVVVAKRSLARGSNIAASDVALETRDLARLRNQYLTDIAGAVGMEVRAPLSPDAVLYTSMLKEPLAVRRGERVTILANRGTVNIKATGEALQDGVAGSQIQVRNQQSERTVYAWVRGPGLVATTP